MATTFVDVTYRGLKLQDKAKLVDEGAHAFLESEAPLPVGTVLAVLAEGSARPARVVGVVEHEAGAQGQPAGMRLSWSGEAVLHQAPVAARAAPAVGERDNLPTVPIAPIQFGPMDAPTVPIVPAVVPDAPSPAEAAADVSVDGSGDDSSAGGDPDASSDGGGNGTSPPASGVYAPGKKPRKSKRRR